MSDLFDDPKHPDWILLVICDDCDMLEQQKNALAPYRKHFADRDIVVVTISPDEANVAHGDCSCNLTTAEVIRRYELSPARVSYVLIDKGDHVKWAAPTLCAIDDVISHIDQMPLHDAENAARRPDAVNQGLMPQPGITHRLKRTG